ncbi:uncharacterized protein LOC112588313 [Harpegnathos saltator]|uniref:uncharacterized protein LOC112588313 n=1 Tax=Harpegnathos saltator TaxID=610380 RepID=UPI000DBEEAA5|nr:uncharacterized protein LOC112588313 [Harpegnathos saltator]
MVGCTIPFCNNSSEKGYILKIIPRDDERRRQWIERINTKYNWTPAKHSCVCEVHFQPEMWEQRSDKKRKLKHNAVPTIFEYFVKKQIPVTIPNTIEETQQPVYEEHTRVLDTLDPAMKMQDMTHATVINDIVEPAPAPTTSLLNDTEHIEVNEKQMVINNTVKPAPVLIISSLKDKVCTSPASDTKEKIANKKLEERNEKLQQRIMLLRKQNKVLRSQIQSLQKSDTNNKYKQVLKKLRFACGITGYEELLQQKIPLLSLRTLQRRIENLKFESGISNDMFHFLQMKVSTFQNDTDRECGLVLNEMSITPNMCMIHQQRHYLEI